MPEESSASDHLELATELAVAWLSNPNTRASAEEVPAFLERMHGALKSLGAPTAQAEDEAPAQQYTPAVTPRRSLASKDHIVSMIDGKPYKTLKRHLAGHGLTPAQYRERYVLKADYPMVAENYAEMRRGLAKKIGLGRKPGQKAESVGNAKPASKSPAKAAAKPKAPRRRIEAAPAPDAAES
jgi:predicted transcriptional regulator